MKKIRGRTGKGIRKTVDRKDRKEEGGREIKAHNLYNKCIKLFTITKNISDGWQYTFFERLFRNFLDTG